MSASSRNEARASSFLAYLALVALAAGIFFRFYHLGWKIYGNDEATTSLRVAGYTLADYEREAFDGRTRSSGDLSIYQHVTAKRNAADTVRSLAVEDPQHPPLFYLLDRGWIEVFGNSVAARRALSALIGVLVPLAGLWLCLELGSPAAGLVMLVLIAVSPFHLLFSQTAREYELWALLILISSALLLRAMRSNTPVAWLYYTISVVLGLYADVLFLYVLFGHALFAGVQWKLRPARSLVYFGIAALCALIAYVPWFYALFGRRNLLTNNSYLHTPLPVKLFALKWIFNTGAVFFDLDYKIVASAVLLIPIFAIVVWAVVEIARHATRQVLWFVAILTLTTALAFVVPDLLHHESRSTAARYLLPTWLGLELAVSFALAPYFGARTSPASRIAAIGSLVLIFACGIVSNIVAAQAPAWWGDGPAAIAPIARIINAADAPLVVFQEDPQQWDFSPVMLTNALRPDVRFQLVPASKVVDPVPNRGTTFLLDPSPALRSELARRNIALTPVYIESGATRPDVAKMRAEADAARVRAGIVEAGPSLWTVSISSVHT